MLHCITGMLIQVAADSIDIVKSPLNLLTQRNKTFLYCLVYRSDIKLWVFQEIKQEFDITVAGSTADTIYGRVKQIDTINNSLLGI